MSIFSKLFKKKEDDFSLDNTFGSDNTDFSKPFDSSSDSFSSPSNDPFGSPSSDSSFPSSFDTPNTTGMPVSQHSPLPPHEDPNIIAPTRGSQMAQDYIAKQQGTSQTTNTQTNSSTKDHTLEMINLKLDAIKSQLEMLNQRLEKVEEKKKLW